MRNHSLVARFLLLVTLFGVCVTLAFSEVTSASAEKSKDPLEGLKFRNLGPAVGGGRVAAVAGVPGQPNVYYVGAAGGGVFKSVDGGLSWKAIFEKEATSSIGAIAVAPSNPNLVWVGTGESNPRNDMITGKGVYFSPDAGASWKFMGLADAGQISQIVVHPSDPNTVYVAVLGHVWGRNQERGVFRTTDGGKSWQKVLYIDDKTGAADLIMVPGNPMVLFAGMWEMQRYPWMLDNGGPNSGIYRSNDGGATWKKLSEGLPKGPLGRIGLAAAPSEPNHIYALVEAKKGVLWDSRDLGDHWTQISDDHRLIGRGFYFTTLAVAPDNANKIYFLSFDVLMSEDGGKSAKIISRGMHPDHHAIWIDPKQPERIIEGNDGGVYISTDAGTTWRYLDNLPIEQFYMVAADDNAPYMLCGGLQDNNGWCGPSNSLSRGGIQGSDWFTVVGGDGEYVVPAGNKSNIVYADSQNGAIQRLNITNGMSAGIRPYLRGVSFAAPKDLKYRFNWTSPIAASPKDVNTVYLGGNVLFKSTDGGKSWTPISPDLTRNDKTKQLSSGGQVWLDLSGAETFGTILSMSLSPVDANVVWVGTDDGLVQVTRDGGKTWTNATTAIKTLPEWGRVQQIEASPFEAGTAYVAFDFHEVDNNKPYVFRTRDFGKTWTAINKGLPESDPARVVRENPNQKGFLALGTDTGLFYSSNDGDSWTPLKANFPTVPVYDIKFIKDTRDLVVATHGRGLFVLDNIKPLEEMPTEVAKKDFHLFGTVPAYRWHMWNKRGFQAGDFVTPNPMAGAVISYYLPKELEVSPEMKRGRRTPVKITVTDADGQLVRTLYGPSKEGINRVSWNLSYQEPVRLAFVQEREDAESEFFGRSQGAPVLPGKYKVEVTANGKTESQVVEVGPDPRYPFDMEAAKAVTKAALEVRDEISAVNDMLNRVDSLKSQVATVQKLLRASDDSPAVKPAAYAPVLENARALEKKLREFEGKIYNGEVQQGSQDRLHYLASFHDRLQGVMGAIIMSGYNTPPSPLALEEMAEVRQEVKKVLAEFNGLVSTEVASFNKLALDKGTNTLFAGLPVELQEANSQSSAGK